MRGEHSVPWEITITGPSLYLEAPPDRGRVGDLVLLRSVHTKIRLPLPCDFSFLRGLFSSVLFFKPTMGVRSFVKQSALLALAVGGSHGIRIIQSNDDGWAELNIRQFHDMLISAGHEAVVSAPAENMSGKGKCNPFYIGSPTWSHRGTMLTHHRIGSKDEDPKPRTDACEYDSCAAGTNATFASNETDPTLNWVNSFPATSMRLGLSTIGPGVWGAGQEAELAVTGPNVGSNLWAQVPFSGTIGSACYAAHEAGIPAIAFSGLSNSSLGLLGGNAAWNADPAPESSAVFAELALNLTSRIIESGAPYLPNDTYLNVNMAAAVGECADPAAYKWVLTRINPSTPLLSSDDVQLCGRDKLPQETEVVHSSGACYVSVSVGDCSDKTTAAADVQQAVVDKIGDMLTCFPA